MKQLLALIFIFSNLFAEAQKVNKKDYLVTMETSKGTVHLVLFDETPLHKANFIKLAEEEFYDGLLFHRVKNEFMIQGGDPNSKNAPKGTRLGGGGGDLDKIPFEFVPERVHLKGALAAARVNNPEKKSSGCQFYIITGKVYTENQLTAMSKRNGLTYTEQQKTFYTTEGGYPSLDMNYTVYGQVIKGIEVVEAIQVVEKDRFDRPTENVSMIVKVKRMRKKKITKKYGYAYSVVKS